MATQAQDDQRVIARLFEVLTQACAVFDHEVGGGVPRFVRHTGYVWEVRLPGGVNVQLTCAVLRDRGG